MALKPKVRCRGLPLQSYIATLEALRGSEERFVLLASITPELRDALAYGEVIAGGCYDLDWLIELHRVGRHIARGGITFSRTMELAAVKRDLRGPFAILMKFVSVANLFVGGCLAILELAGTLNGRVTVEPPSTPTATYVTAFEWDG